MHKHNFQKQNQSGVIKQKQSSFARKAAIILGNPQSEQQNLNNYSSIHLLHPQSQQALSIFQSRGHNHRLSLIPAVSHADDRKIQVTSILEISFNEDTKRTIVDGTATFNNTSERSSVSNRSHSNSRFVESRLQRKGVAYQIFNAIKVTQEDLEQKKKQIIKAFDFRPVKIKQQNNQATIPILRERRF